MSDSYIKEEIILEPEKKWSIDELQGFLVKFKTTFSYDYKTQSDSFSSTDKFLTCELMYNGEPYITITYYKNNNITVKYHKVIDQKTGKSSEFTYEYKKTNLRLNVNEFHEKKDEMIRKNMIEDYSEFKFKFTLHLNKAYKHTHKELTDFLIDYDFKPSVTIGNQRLTKETLNNMINKAKLNKLNNLLQEVSTLANKVLQDISSKTSELDEEEYLQETERERNRVLTLLNEEKKNVEKALKIVHECRKNLDPNNIDYGIILDADSALTLVKKAEESVRDRAKSFMKDLRKANEAARKKKAENPPDNSSGGKKSKKLPKKEILGKMRCIYKIPGDRKEYLKHKGKLITVKEYKELMKAKSSKPKPKKKVKKKST